MEVVWGEFATRIGQYAANLNNLKVPTVLNLFPKELVVKVSKMLFYELNHDQAFVR